MKTVHIENGGIVARENAAMKYASLLLYLLLRCALTAQAQGEQNFFSAIVLQRGNAHNTNWEQNDIDNFDQIEDIPFVLMAETHNIFN